MKRKNLTVLPVLISLTGLLSPAAYPWVTEVVDQQPSGGAGGEYASIALDSSGFVHICSQNESVGGLQYTTNSSGTWVSTILDGTTHGDIGSHASITVDSLDRVHISYKGELGLKYATNASGGWVISVVEVEPLGSTGYCTSIAADRSGRVHISYIGQRGWELYLRYATNTSGSWQRVTLDSPYSAGPFVVQNYTSIALDSADRVHISYCWDALKYATNASGTWATETVDSIFMRQNSIGVDDSDSVHISYFDITNSKLKVATNASGSWDTETVDSAEYGGTSIVIDTAGKAQISYRGEAGDLRYATNASGIWVTEPVDASSIGYYASIGLDGAGGAVHLAYHDATDHALKYATNASGLWVTTQLESVGTVGRASSLALDDSQGTHISYADDTNATLKYATNASGAWVKETVDPVVAEDTAIALDDSGKAYISYIRAYGTHWDDADLKIASNVSGSWQTATLDFCPGASSRSTSIAVDDAEHVHVSYTSDGLKVATNTSGEWITETVDASGGADNSIALDSLGNVHIGYRAGGGLKVATNASGTWQQTELDPTAWKYCSLAVDSADRLHITYVSYIDDHPCLRYATNVSGAWVTQTVHASTLGLEFFEDASIAVDSGGTVHLCHREAITSNLRYTTNVSGAWVLSNICSRVQGGGKDASIAIGPSGRIRVGHHGGDGTLLVTSGSGTDNPAWRPAATLANESRVASATANHLLFVTLPVGVLLFLKAVRRPRRL